LGKGVRLPEPASPSRSHACCALQAGAGGGRCTLQALGQQMPPAGKHLYMVEPLEAKVLCVYARCVNLGWPALAAWRCVQGCVVEPLEAFMRVRCVCVCVLMRHQGGAARRTFPVCSGHSISCGSSESTSYAPPSTSITPGKQPRESGLHWPGWLPPMIPLDLCAANEKP